MHIITTDKNADFDGFASMIAAQKLYPEAILVFPGSQKKSLHDFIAQTITYDYNFQTTESIDLSKVTRLTIVDTQRAEDIGELAKCLSNDNIHVHIYDHYEPSEETIKADVIEYDDLGACTSLFAQKFREENTEISSEEATIFALGIYNDTQSLTYKTTKPNDIYAVAWLVEKGAQLSIIATFLQGALGFAQEEIIREIKKQADIFTIQHHPVTISSLALPRHISDFPFIVQRFCEIEKIDSLFVLLEAEGRIHLSAYSTVEEIDPGAIARDMGGTGNHRAGTAKLQVMRMTEAEAQLIELLQTHTQARASAAEMMTSPAITIAPDISLKQANDSLTRYNITALPVVESRGIVGIISRQVVEKALHHDLGHLPVSSYMSTEIHSISLSAQLPEIQTLIVERRQRLLPVVDGSKVLGIITRTDLLNRLVTVPEQDPKAGLPRKTAFTAQKRNIAHMVHSRLDGNMVELLTAIGKVADEISFNAFAVGGFVRDLLLNRPNKDLDIVVEGSGIAFAKKLAEKMGGKCLTHEHFLTAVVTLPNRFKIDVATARLEYYDSPASLPMVQLSSIKHDLSRRDFAINAMALQINSRKFGVLYDYFNSQADLNNGKIRVLHNLSFVEDPSRIFRAIRFEARMNFQIGPHTKGLIENAVNMNLFGKARDPRFLTELKIMFGEKDPLSPLLRLAEFQFFQYLWPDLRPSYRVDRRFCHTIEQTQAVLARHNELDPKAKKEIWIVYLLSIFHRSSLEELQAFCTRFNEEQKNTKKLINTKRVGDSFSEQLHKRPQIKNSEIFNMLQDASPEVLLYVASVARKTFVRQAILRFTTELRHTKSRISGKDLMSMGYAAGPQFREILHGLQAARMDGVTTSFEEEKAYLQQNFPLDDL